MAGYIGNAPVAEATQTRDKFTATSGQTSFATSGYTPGYLDVYYNGIHLDPTDFTATNGSDVVLNVGASTGDELIVVAWKTFNATTISEASVTQHEAALTITESQISDLQSYLTSETNTSLSLASNTLTYTDETGATNNIDLSAYLDDTTNTVLSAALSGNTITFTREDSTTFNLDVTNLYDDTNLVTSVNGQTGAVTVNSELVDDTTPQLGGDLDTNGNDINFGDNDKALFGAGNDLQIYSDGTDSYIKENGSGSLVLQGQQYIVLEDTNGDNYIRCSDGNEVRLYHSGSPKLNTTSTGIDVTGNVVADGLTVAGTSSLDGAVTINESGADVDFRVETNNQTHALFVDGGGDDVCMFKSAIGDTTAGFDVRPSGQLTLVTDGGNRALLINHQNNDGNSIEFKRANSLVGTVSVTSSGTTYNTTSDRRLKDNIELITDSKEKLLAMKPCTFTFKADEDNKLTHGFIAQEMQEIIPEAVSGDENSDEMMSMDYGRITPVIVAALQDALNEIDSLKRRVKELENK